MPSIFELYEKVKDLLSDPVVIRLHGMDREGIEERTKNIWDMIVDPRDSELLQLISVVNDLRERQHQVFVNVNNHFEGSAPRTIEKIKALLTEHVLKEICQSKTQIAMPVLMRQLPCGI